MASTPRSTVSLSRQALRQYRAQNAPILAGSFSSTCSRAFATSAPRPSQEAAAEQPRWSYTPERMKAPFPIGIRKTPMVRQWLVNEDPKKLDDALSNFLARDCSRLLPDELKWLAVTHKSFDQARRGFNDRLGFLGRQICVMEATQSIIYSTAPAADSIVTDLYAHKREPFGDPALRRLDNLSLRQPMDFFKLDKLSKLARETGVSHVVRWKPRMPENLLGSGYEPVMSGAVFAIIGAVALQNGGKIASKVARERVLNKIQL